MDINFRNAFLKTINRLFQDERTFLRNLGREGFKNRMANITVVTQ